MYACVCMRVHVYVYVHVYGVLQLRGVVRSAPRTLCYTPVETITSFISPVADLGSSNKPCLKAAISEPLFAQAHICSETV